MENKQEKMARRPLKSRETKWAQSLSLYLVRKNVSPDLISVWSFVFGLSSGICFACSFVFANSIQTIVLVLAAVFIQLRLLCNLLDGMVAVEGGKGGPIGPVMNELPDRVSDIAILLGVTVAISHLPYVLYIGALATIAAVMTAYIRALAGSVGAKQRFDGWFGKSQRMALLTGIALIAAFLSAKYAAILFYIALVIVLAGSIQTCWVRTRLLLGDMRELNKPSA